MICDLGELDSVVAREVLERFDHQNLNCLPEFSNAVPTSENLCKAIYQVCSCGCARLILKGCGSKKPR